MKKTDMIALLKLIERLPSRYYVAPDAVHDLARQLAIPEDEAVKFVQLRVECRMPGDDVYLYGSGILLRDYDRNKLVKCLNRLVFGKKGRPKLEDDERRDKANQDCQVFKKLVAEEAAQKKRGAKQRVYKALEKKWRLTDAGVRRRVKNALKHEDELPF
jgi:hypothetical protein